MRIHSAVLALPLIFGIISAAVFAAGEPDNPRPALGIELRDTAVAELPPAIFADGTGLPEGEGNSALGEEVFDQECSICHGREGIGGAAMELIGDRSLLATEYPDKGIAVYWPYAPPLFDYIRRAMPPSSPYSLSNEEIYAVIAYLLERSDLLEAGAYLDATRLSSIVMPNRNNFINIYSDKAGE